MCNSRNAIMNTELTMLRLRQHIQATARHKSILPHAPGRTSTSAGTAHASRSAAGTANLAGRAQRRTRGGLDRARCRRLMAFDGGVGFDALCAAFVGRVGVCG